MSYLISKISRRGRDSPGGPKPETTRAGKPRQRSKDSSLRYAVEELKFVRSFAELKVLYRNTTYLLPRLLGTLDRPSDAPPSLQIEPTNLCNANCVCCPIAGMVRARGYMDLSLFKKIIDDAARSRVQRVRLFLHGEPMMHPRIVEMIAYCKSKGVAVHLTTNGMPFTRRRSEAILRSGVNSADHFTFSILGYSKEVHEAVMRNVRHDRVVRNIQDFLDLRRELRVNGPVVETVFYTMAQNESEEQQYLDFWRGIVDHARLGGRISESFAGYNKETAVVPRTKTCSNIWERLTVFWNGDVSLCCEDVNGKFLLGNLREQTIQQVWTGEQLRSIQSIHRAGEFSRFPFCLHCDM